MLLQIVEIIVGLCGLFYGFFEHYKRQKLENVVKTISQTFPGDVAKIEESCVWAWANVRNAHKELAKTADFTEKAEILAVLNSATADALASSRLCYSLFNQLLAFQQAQFDTRIIIHPEKDFLDLCRKEMNSTK